MTWDEIGDALEAAAMAEPFKEPLGPWPKPLPPEYCANCGAHQAEAAAIVERAEGVEEELRLTREALEAYEDSPGVKTWEEVKRISETGCALRLFYEAKEALRAHQGEETGGKVGEEGKPSLS